MRFLLDSDIGSAYLKGNRDVQNRFLQYGGRLHVSVITVGELVTYDVAFRFGAIRAPLLDRGRPAPGMDMMIAATALVHGLTLSTHNTQVFANAPGLSLVDWLAP